MSSLNSTPGLPEAESTGGSPKRSKKWLRYVGLALLILIGGCTAIGLLVDSPEEKLGSSFISALYKSDQAAADKMCKQEITPEIIAANRKGLVSLRKDLLAKGWKGGSSMDSPRKSSIKDVSLAAMSGTLETSPKTKVTLSIMKFKALDMCVGTVEIDGKGLGG
jgi:hypothetical protein